MSNRWTMRTIKRGCLINNNMTYTCCEGRRASERRKVVWGWGWGVGGGGLGGLGEGAIEGDRQTDRDVETETDRQTETVRDRELEHFILQGL